MCGKADNDAHIKIRDAVELFKVRGADGRVIALDFAKAFDSVRHSHLSRVLTAVRLPERVRELVLSL